MNGIAVK